MTIQTTIDLTYGIFSIIVLVIVLLTCKIAYDHNQLMKKNK
jgi:hypothetical protein